MPCTAGVVLRVSGKKIDIPVVDLYMICINVKDASTSVGAELSAPGEPIVPPHQAPLPADTSYRRSRAVRCHLSERNLISNVHALHVTQDIKKHSAWTRPGHRVSPIRRPASPPLLHFIFQQLFVTQHARIPLRD